MAEYKTRLGGSTATFDNAMKKGFGVMTVFDAVIYPLITETSAKTSYEILKAVEQTESICTLDSLKAAVVNTEGPEKVIKGGIRGNTLIKSGKSARLEMTDALGNAQALDALGGAVAEYETTLKTGTMTGLHFGEDFNKDVTIVGTTYIVDKESGEEIQVKVIFYDFLPDAITSIDFDSEGEGAVFSFNGDLKAVDVKLGTESGSNAHGLFYSIVDPKHVPSLE